MPDNGEKHKNWLKINTIIGTILLFFTDEELRANTHNVAPEYNLGDILR